MLAQPHFEVSHQARFGMPQCGGGLANANFGEVLAKESGTENGVVVATPPMARGHLQVLFRAEPETLATVAADFWRLGAQIGVTAVLHTWGQPLQYHPHIHCVVPGGGLSFDGTRWIACRPGFFLPVRVLSRLFVAWSYRNCRMRSRWAS
ncbi:hypothetical protein J2R78_001563 [Bradyrhizobium sp. USDA 4538]|nr:hypothetical protein [Bradyrhizobium sp. USDA 4538]MCP1899161.1 hypothetical protein [Bradyrhizobium sp. USDA 4537]MCP1986727.1 hypothetical protein [Bradyrhizobium sp. USDA 4539]